MSTTERDIEVDSWIAEFNAMDGLLVDRILKLEDEVERLRRHVADLEARLSNLEQHR